MRKQQMFPRMQVTFPVLINVLTYRPLTALFLSPKSIFFFYSWKTRNNKKRGANDRFIQTVHVSNVIYKEVGLHNKNTPKSRLEVPETLQPWRYLYRAVASADLPTRTPHAASRLFFLFFFLKPINLK